MGKVPVDAVETSLEILCLLDPDDTRSVTELAERLGRPKATVYYHLQTLSTRGYAVETDEGYELGLRVLELGGRFRRRDWLVDIVEPDLKRLARESNEIAVLAVRDDDAAVLLSVERPVGLESTVDLAVGTRLPLHGSAVGKAILSALSETQLDTALETVEFERYTSETITEEGTLRDHLAEVRSDGHAFERDEHRSGVNAIATPVHDEDGTVVGSLGVSGPSTRLYDDRFTHELPHLVRRIAERVEHEFATS